MALCEFQFSFYKNIFVLTVIMGIFYFISFWRRLKIHKIEERFFLSTTFGIQNNPLMQSSLIFHKTINKSTQQVKVIGLAVFQQLKKTVTRVGTFVLLVSLFLSTHINLQYELNSYESLFIVTVNLFSSVFLPTFSHLKFHCFFLKFFFISLMNMNK